MRFFIFLVLFSILFTSCHSATVTSSRCLHQIVIDEEKEATCFEDGWTQGSHCSLCGEVLEAQELIPHGHHFELEEICLKSKNEIERESHFYCKACQNLEIRELNPEDIHMPIITIEGSLEGVSKDNKVKVKVHYQSENDDFESLCTLKVQGATSAGFPKKNYNIQFIDENGLKKKVLLNDSWGKQSKYCLKANWIDASQARNVVSAKIYGKIVHSRAIEDEFDSLVNGGAIDGFPVLIYNNNEFLGLYTLNIPKDKWMFAMNDDIVRQGIIMADDWTESVFLKEPIAEDFSNGWDNEYCSTEDSEGTKWMVDSFNNLIDFLNRADDDIFMKQIDEFVNVPRAIDSFIYTYLILGWDNISKNILWVTFDGIKWAPSVYDLDATWGLQYHGQGFDDYNGLEINRCDYYWNNNLLWKRLYKSFKDKIVKRYFELRKDILSYENIMEEFSNFITSIPKIIYDTDFKRWIDIPSKETNNLNQIEEFTNFRLDFYDQIMENL